MQRKNLTKNPAFKLGGIKIFFSEDLNEQQKRMVEKHLKKRGIADKKFLTAMGVVLEVGPEDFTTEKLIRVRFVPLIGEEWWHE